MASPEMEERPEWYVEAVARMSLEQGHSIVVCAREAYGICYISGKPDVCSSFCARICS